MIIITRTKDQSVQIGDHITITVLEVGNGRVRIGVEAPLAPGMPGPFDFAASAEQGDASNPPTNW